LRKNQKIILLSFFFGILILFGSGIFGSIQNKDLKEDWVEFNLVIENINNPNYPTVQLLNELNKKYPRNCRLYFYSAYANMNQNHLGESEYYFDEALKLRPVFLLNTHFLLSYSRVVNANGNTEKAIVLLKAAEKNGINENIKATYDLAKEEIYGKEEVK
jgi:predicted Zn-dependent protease